MNDDFSWIKLYRTKLIPRNEKDRSVDSVSKKAASVEGVMTVYDG